MIRLTCPKCEKKLSIDDRFAGRMAACPRCKTRILVPSDDEDAESSEELPVAGEFQEDNDEPSVGLNEPAEKKKPKRAREQEADTTERTERTEHTERTEEPSGALYRLIDEEANSSELPPPAKEKDKRAPRQQTDNSKGAETANSADSPNRDAAAGYKLIHDSSPASWEAPSPPAKEKRKRTKTKAAGKAESADVNESDEAKEKKEKNGDAKPSAELLPTKGKQKPPKVKSVKAGDGAEDAESAGEEKDDEAVQGDKPFSDPAIPTTGTLKSPLEALVSLNWLWLLLLTIGSSSLVLSMLAHVAPRLAYGVIGVGLVVFVWGWLWVLNRVFSESILDGVLCFVTFFYFFYFFSSHYDDYHRPFYVTVTGMAILAIGILSSLSVN